MSNHEGRSGNAGGRWTAAPAHAGDPLRRALERERRARRQSELIAEQATRALYLSNQELKERERQQAAVVQLGEVALGGGETHPLFVAACRIVAQTLDVPLCGILRVEREPPVALRLVAGTGWLPAQVGHMVVEAAPGSHARHTLESASSVISLDLAHETRFAPDRLLVENGVVSSIATVIHGTQGPLGLLGAHARRARPFSANDATFLQSIAQVITGAVRRRDAELAFRESEEKLRQSQKMEAMGRLAGGLAHDLNNLLTVLLGHASLLEIPGSVTGDHEADVEGIHRAADRAASLVQQLLAFGRKQMLQIQTLDVNTLVQRTADMLVRLLGEKTPLRTLLSPDAGCMSADKNQMEQVLVNLVLNARDAMPDGGQVTIETCRRHLDAPLTSENITLPPGEYAQISVSDSGPEMDPATLARIFEPFFSTKGLRRGSGLGLATVHGIVAQSGGAIQPQSAHGQGTTFRVLLPRVAPAAKEPDRKEHVPAAGGRLETILVVDDQAEVRALLARTLSGSGYRVLTATGGTEALELLGQEGETVSLLLSDVVMPRMNGRELAERALALRPELKVLYMSGYTDDALGSTDWKASNVAFIAKPFTTEALRRRLRELLDGPGLQS